MTGTGQPQPQRSIEDIDADEQRELDDYRAEMEHWYGDRHGQPQQGPALDAGPYWGNDGGSQERQAGVHVHERGQKRESYIGTGNFTSGMTLTDWQCKTCDIRESQAWWDGYKAGVSDAAASGEYDRGWQVGWKAGLHEGLMSG